MDSDLPTMADSLTKAQVADIVAVERAGASLSLVGIVLITVTFAMFKRLRTVPNTFILFASLANIGASVACLIGNAGLAAGVSSNLCQVQAFLLEMFMQSDPWWSLAMAVNVFMVFFLTANPTTFRQYLWIYCIICYGAPAIPAVICLILRRQNRGLVYGDATLWCWIDWKWNSLRIYSYYAPIWVCIFLSACIYIAVGYYVFHQRNQLRNLSLTNPVKEASCSDRRDSAEKNLTGETGYYGTVTTEVQISRDSCDTFPSSPVHSPVPSLGTIAPPPPASGSAQRSWPAPSSAHSDMTRPLSRLPSGFQTTSMVTSRKPPKRGCSGAFSSIYGRCTGKLKNLDPVKLAYLRTSFIFAVSVLVTWTPSSINRVYTLVYPDRVSFGLNIASALVLPLQGAWNAIIYFMTSWSTFREEALGWWCRSGWHQHLGSGARLDGVNNNNAAYGNRFGPPSGVGQGRFGRGWGPDMEMSPRLGTLRVVKGGHFDDPSLGF